LPLIIDQQVKTGKVRFVWKDFPLSIHFNAQKAHEAARYSRDLNPESTVYEGVVPID